MKFMKTILILFVALVSTAVGADQFSMFFRYGKGTRIDYTQASPQGASSEDTFPATAVIHVLIPENSSIARISLTYGKDAKGREDQSYEGTVIHRTNDMISVIIKFGASDKVESIVIYPKKDSAFLTVQSAYLGSDLMKALSESNSEIPYGSVSIFRLSQLQK